MARKNLILHVGRHKTGTSALQRFLCRKREELRSQGIIYPSTGRIVSGGEMAPAHHQIANLCNPKFTKRAAFYETQKSFFEEISGYDGVIVSSEAFQNISRPTLLKKFFREFREFDVIVIAYFREYLSYLVSTFAQRIQNQKVFMTFDEMCREGIDIQKFLDMSPKIGEVRYRPYDRECLVEGDIIQDFLETSGLTLDREEVERANPSIGGNLLFFKLAANYQNWEFPSYKEQGTLAQTHDNFRGPFYIDTARAKAIRRSSSYNRDVAKWIGALPERNFDVFRSIPSHETLMEDYSLIRILRPTLPSAEQFQEFAETASRRWF